MRLNSFNEGVIIKICFVWPFCLRSMMVATFLILLPLPALRTAVNPAGPVSQMPMLCWRAPAG